MLEYIHLKEMEVKLRETTMMDVDPNGICCKSVHGPSTSQVNNSEQLTLK